MERMSFVHKWSHEMTPATPQKNLIQNFFVPHFFTFLFGIILIAGIVTGSLITKKINMDMISQLGLITNEFIKVKIEQTFLQNFISFFSSGLLYLLLLFLMGFTAISQPIILAVVFFKGLGLGLSLGYAYSMMGQNGIFASLIFLLPNALFISIAIIWAAKESLKLSVLFFFKLFSTQNETNLGLYAKRMCVKYIGITVFCVVGSIIGTGIVSVFGTYFMGIDT